MRETDDRRVQLETRVAEAQRLEWALRQRIEELERRLRDMGQPLPSVPAIPRQERHADPLSQATEAGRTDGDEFAAVLHQSMLREQARAVAMPVQTSRISPQPAMQRPMSQEMQTPILGRMTVPQTRMTSPFPRQREAVAAMPMPSAAPSAPQHVVEPVAEEEPPPREDEMIAKARALLRAGRTIEKVARETGVEIGALRLMKQMEQRD